MSYTKQTTLTKDLSRSKYAGNVPVNILDKEVYSVVMTITSDGTTAVDLTGDTVEFILDGATLGDVTVTDAANGVVTILFNDFTTPTTYVANKLYNIILKITDGTVERHYEGFTLSTYTLP